MSAKRYFPLFLSALILPFAAACAPPAQNMNVEGDGWVIFSAEKAQEAGLGSWVFGDDQPIEYWTPSEQDVVALEKGLPDYLRENSNLFYSPDAPVWERLDGYNRQYFGAALEGRKLLYANFFCHGVGMDWEKDFVIVMDGGACFFQFKYDSESGEYFDLRVNGEA